MKKNNGTKPLISVVIATKNEENNIENCLKSIIAQTYPSDKIELIVIDNNSSDNTEEIAKKFTDKFYSIGPKRASQLNFGVEMSKGNYILYPDADMILSENVIEECVYTCEKKGCIALYIPEKIIGNGFWIKVRDFERSFYEKTCIDAVRFVARDVFVKSGGFDENIDFGPDDWDFNRRIKQIGNLDIIKSPIFHNEGKFELKRYLAKKKKYTATFKKYIEKWGAKDPIIKKQLGGRYRLFGVYTEKGKWKKFIKNPVATIGMYFLRFMVGIQYILVKNKPEKE